MGHVGHEGQIGVGRRRELEGGTAAALRAQILDGPEGERKDLDVRFGVVAFGVAGVAVPFDVADHAGQATRTGNRRRPAEQVAKLHRQKFRGGSRVAVLIVEPLRDRQWPFAVDAEPPFVAMLVAGVEMRVREGGAVRRVLVGVDESGGEYRAATAIEHGGVRQRTAYRVEIPHDAQAAIETNVDALIHAASLREQDFGTNDQTGCLSRARRWRVGAMGAIGSPLGIGNGGASV